MRFNYSFSVLALTACLLGATLSPGAAAERGSVGLTGKVTSDAEGKMEGVVVSAKRVGSTVTVSVTSDESGTYGFPADRLEPGQYSLKIRAIGYELEGPSTTEIAARKTSHIDLKLNKTNDLASQLTNGEWLASIPGSNADKEVLLWRCNYCHEYERIVRSTYDADQWTRVITRMFRYAVISTPLKPQMHMDPTVAGTPEMYRKQAEYLASINLSSKQTWDYPLKTLPRPTGRATRVIVTEYDLPRKTIQPHDVIVDKQGTIWYVDFGDLFLGKFNPKMLKLTEYQIKANKLGYPVGSLDLEFDPKNGTLWFDMMYQAAVGNFDPGTEKFTYYPIPPELDHERAQVNFLGLRHDVDNRIWTKDVGKPLVYRIDLSTGKWETFPAFKGLAGGPYGIYQVISDSKNNLWMAEILDGSIGRIDAKTGDTKWYFPPTPHSADRRLNIDDKDVLVIAEYRGNKIATLDTNTEIFTEWALPTEWTNPYRVSRDKNGEYWTGGMSTDRVVRLDPQSGEFIEYLMPNPTNMRSSFIDNSTARPTF